MNKRGRLVICFILIFASFIIAYAETLKPATIKAWDRYYQWADAKVRSEVQDPAKFLIQQRLSLKDRNEVLRHFKSGTVYVDRVTNVIPDKEKFSCPDGAIHHWWGTILLPKVQMHQLMAFLKDYDHHAGKFSDVVKSKLESNDGEHYVFTFRLMRSKSVVTAHYNTIQEATYYPVDAKHIWSKSIATKIAELKDANTPKEKELPPGEDRGFLWRLASWWRFQETDEGVIIELESASLSQNIPGWVAATPWLGSYIKSTPKETLESVLVSIRKQFAASGGSSKQK